ncbi:MAG TPA: TadE/TadG family type IV pilus assembly protein [Acidimicrobiales bacterium]|nr:TadE/TadG family type IV pilus assembly protein [Acidimicrobiales bacterium]
MNRRRGEEGLSSTALAVVMPVILVWIMLVVQYGLWAHARQVAEAAADQGAGAGALPGADPTAAADAAVRSFLAGAGPLDDLAVAVEPGPDSLTVRVSGQAPRLVPGFAWDVQAVSQAPLEQYVPEERRPR